MSQSTRLALPYLAAAQAQKHVTVNESLRRLDALVQLSAVSASIATQPASPTDGSVYILPAGKTGAAWGAMANEALAYYRDGAWEQLTPKPGWLCFVEDEKTLFAFTGAGWSRVAGDGQRRLLFTPGGDGVVSIYRIDTARAQNPRTAAISAISSDVITLTTTTAGLFFADSMMKNVSYVRIWNTSKSPAQSAWVKEQPANNQLKVVSAAALSGWANGETIQLGDTPDYGGGNYIAVDISPMMQAVLGRVFRQSGVLCKLLTSGNAVQSRIEISEAGVSGANQPLRSFTDGSTNTGQAIAPCSVLSPVSNSNLVFVREVVSGSNMLVGGVSIMGVYV
jgi:hypothetical protein